MNELLWPVMLAVNFGCILVSYRIFGKTGLYAWIPLAAIVANIQVIKLVELFGITATLGNIVYASSFLVTDILSEMYGKKTGPKSRVHRAVFPGGHDSAHEPGPVFHPGPG